MQVAKAQAIGKRHVGYAIFLSSLKRPSLPKSDQTMCQPWFGCSTPTSLPGRCPVLKGSQKMPQEPVPLLSTTWDAG